MQNRNAKHFVPMGPFGMGTGVQSGHRCAGGLESRTFLFTSSTPDLNAPAPEGGWHLDSGDGRLPDRHGTGIGGGACRPTAELALIHNS